jgi:adenosine deaminase
MTGLKDFIRGLPKAELHLHIEGSLEPELMFELAARNGIALPFKTVEEVRAAYAFSNLQDFLDIYYQGAGVLMTEQDFHDLAMAYFRRVAVDGCRHVELFFDPQTHTDRGLPFSVAIDGLLSGMAEAEIALGVSSKLILCFLRHLSAEDAARTLAEALAFRDWIAGVGLDSSEAGNPPSKFEAVFASAREAGFLAVAHAGEEGPAAYIREALDVLHARRIDHGVRCVEDPELVADLAARRIPLTVCPLSNVRLGVFPELSRHNLKDLLRRGLCVTINSDDPAYFGGYVAENYRAAREALVLSREDVIQLAKNSFEASFLPPEEKERWINAVDAFAAANP